MNMVGYVKFFLALLVAFLMAVVAMVLYGSLLVLGTHLFPESEVFVVVLVSCVFVVGMEKILS